MLWDFSICYCNFMNEVRSLFLLESKMLLKKQQDVDSYSLTVLFWEIQMSLKFYLTLVQNTQSIGQNILEKRQWYLFWTLNSLQCWDGKWWWWHILKCFGYCVAQLAIKKEQQRNFTLSRSRRVLSAPLGLWNIISF